jgi:NitT/TauT family transport system substrate-binding protein
MLATSAEFASKYPVATKRVLRAILKAADLCASEPERVAQRLVDQGFTKRYDYAAQALSEIRYDILGGISTRRTRSASTRWGCTRRA